MMEEFIRFLKAEFLLRIENRLHTVARESIETNSKVEFRSSLS